MDEINYLKLAIHKQNRVSYIETIGFDRRDSNVEPSNLIIFVSAFVTSLIQLISCEYNVTDIVIRPVSLTTRGAIWAGRVCPPGEVAIGFRLKMENHVGTPWTEGAINPDNKLV